MTWACDYAGCMVRSLAVVEGVRRGKWRFCSDRCADRDDVSGAPGRPRATDAWSGSVIDWDTWSGFSGLNPENLYRGRRTGAS